MARSITIRMPDEQYAKLERRARLKGVSVSQLVRVQLGAQGGQPADAEAAVHRALVEAGLVVERVRPAFDAEAFRAWTPMQVIGRPLSETLVEDRR